MSLLPAKFFIFLLLNGGPLSENCWSGLPYVSYISPSFGITLSELVDCTNFAAGKRDFKSWTTMTCFVEGIGPYRSTDTFSHDLFGILCALIGSVVFLSVNN